MYFVRPPSLHVDNERDVQFGFDANQIRSGPSSPATTVNDANRRSRSSDLSSRRLRRPLELTRFATSERGSFQIIRRQGVGDR